MSFDLAFVDSIGAVYDSITDAFTRTVAAGSWDGADTGQAWTISGAVGTDYSVNGTKGVQSNGTVNVARRSTLTVGSTDQVVTASFTVPVTPSGAGFSGSLLLRYVDSSNHYLATAQVNIGGSVDLRLRKNIAGTFTTLDTVTGVGTFSAGNTFMIKAQIVGAELRAKVWETTEPATWQAAATDMDLTSGSNAGVRSILDSGNTNALPVAFSWDDFSVTSPTRVRLDLNDDVNIRTLAEGTDFGVPELDRAVADTLLTDGAIVPAAAYTNRVLTLHLRFLSGDYDTNAALLQDVIRELDRAARDPYSAANFLRYQAGTSQPVFFRTMRSSASRVVWDAVSQEATVPILAEPFAYGLRVTGTPVTVDNNPAASSNGQYLDVTGVTGDVETPLYMILPSAGLVVTGGVTSVIATRRRGTPANAPFVLQAESMTLGTDTTLPGNDATMSGLGSNYARISFATTTSMATRLSTTFASTVRGTDMRGTYRVYIRIRRSASDGATIRFQAGGDNGATVTGDTVSCPATTSILWVDLGRLSLPVGPDPVTDGPSGVELEAWRGYLEIQAARTGTGTLDVDAIDLVPADDRLLLASWPRSSGATDIVLDSGRTIAYCRGSALEVRANDIVTLVGGPPMVSPGVTNRVYMLRNVGSANADTLSTYSVTYYYWPRYVSVARPPAS